MGSPDDRRAARYHSVQLVLGVAGFALGVVYIGVVLVGLSLIHI